jgi:hypothetical protein
MSFKLPQPAKDFFDIIRAIGSYLGIAAFGIFYWRFRSEY